MAEGKKSSALIIVCLIVAVVAAVAGISILMSQKAKIKDLRESTTVISTVAETASADGDVVI